MTPLPEQVLACRQSAATALDSAACLLAAFRRIGVPASMLDVGCGGGHLVRIASALGTARAIGLDIALEQRVTERHAPGAYLHLIPTDLRRPVPGLAATHDLVLCLEVAEHLPPESAEMLCDTLAGGVATGGTLLFSAATPGQGGAGHLNERPHGYWRGLLTARGLVEDGALTADLRRRWSELAPQAWWYGRNVMAFRRPA